MIKDRLEEASNDLGLSFEEAQNTLNLKARLQLLSYINDKNYFMKQQNARGKFRLSLLKIATQELRAINQKYDKVFSEVLKSVNLTKNEEARKRLLEIKHSNAVMMNYLAANVYEAHQNWLNRVNAENLNANKELEIGRLQETETLYNSISKVLNNRQANEEVAVVYSNGARHTFKSYMEMKARTTLNQEIGKQQMEAAVETGDVFWLCNNFEDCRPSHLEYQGRIYYDERYLSMGFSKEQIQEIEKAISDRGMLSRQQVENSEPFLGNCPNCRHEFVSVPIEDVISMSDKELLKDNNMNVDKATNEKYVLSQEQRLYERKIREYKFLVEQDKLLLSNAPKGVTDEITSNKIEHNKMMLDRYYGKIRNLVKDNSNWMERDYSRESAKYLREDLGYRARKH